MIRKATENDIKAIAEIYEDIHTDEEAGKLSIGWQRGVYPTEQTAADSVAKGDMFVCERDGKIVAAAKINKEQVDVYEGADWEFPAPDEEVCVLHTLVVSPAAMTSGIGKEFVKFYEDYALETGCPYLRMDTNERNERARAFYKKVGYKEIGIVPCVFNGIDGVNLVLLEKKLDPHQTDISGANPETRLEQQLNFSLEIDKVKNIFRQTHLSGGGRSENDAEHSWHMAIMAYLLREYSNEEIDIAKVMLMCLIHDIVEIDAGDTYAYDDSGLETQKEREDAAKERIFSMLPEDQAQELIALFDEFEAFDTPESKFAHAIDNVQPLMLNNSNNGGDWRKHQVSAEKVYKRHNQTKLGSDKLFDFTDRILQENIAKGNIKK